MEVFGLGLMRLRDDPPNPLDKGGPEWVCGLSLDPPNPLDKGELESGRLTCCF